MNTDAQSHDRPGWRGLHGVVIIALMYLATQVPSLHFWPFFWVAPLVGYGLLVALVPPLRATFRPWRVGRLTGPGVAGAVVIAAGSCAILLLFQGKTDPDLGALGAFLRSSMFGGVVVFGVILSIFNALFEEIIFRGILFDAAESQWGVWGAAIMTAILFGLGHMRGYPPGLLGAFLAGLCGLCLAWLRVHSRGLGLPFLAHVVADATIYTIVVRAGVL